MIRVVLGLVVLSGIFLMVFQIAQWYADNASLPRYCDNPDGHLTLVRQILQEAAPAGVNKRRPYIIAAKLIYLVPRQAGEPVEAYLGRVRARIVETCR
ncbi:MAG: hypothetical protein ACTSUD_13565 [Alphaproteobacteria bacterium]